MERKIFCLTDGSGNLLPPNVQATILAKYSRSPLSAQSIVSTLTPVEADRFQNRWFVEWGHSSVGELAVLPVCFEGVSIVASKFIESYQRPGYSEKSTRYQEFSADSFITPMGAPPSMKAFVQRLYTAYARLHPRAVRHCAMLMGKDPDDPAVIEDRTVRARAFDNVRYLLPAGTGTNLGMVAFGRDLRYLVCDALGHSNREIRAIGEGVREAVEKVCPAFVSGAAPDSFEPPVRSLGPMTGHDPSNPTWHVSLHRPHLLPDPALAQKAFETVVSERYGMSWSAFSKHMEGRGDRCVPKVFRTQRLQFDVMMDYGAYRDLQRHRRCEQYSEPLSSDYGYLVPADIEGTDMEPEYRAAMESVTSYEDVMGDCDLAQYVVPLGYLHRTVFDMDLQELYYIVELRTRPQGHISYRKIAYAMYELASQRCPLLLQWCRAVEPTSVGVHR